MVSTTTNQVKIIKEQFTDRISAAGYVLVASSALKGHEALTFRKNVNEYLFLVCLYFQPPTGKVGEGKLFGVSIGIDLLDGFAERNPHVKQSSDLNSIVCPFSIQSFSAWEKLDLDLANRQRANPYSVREKWSVGANMKEARIICNEALDFPFQWIQKYEQLFCFPAPLEDITIQSLYDVRDSEILSDLLAKTGAQVDKLAQTLLYFYKRRGEQAKVAALKEFVEGKKQLDN